MASSDATTRGLLIAYDAMGVPGRVLTLVADLVEEGFLTHPPLGGEILLFQHRGRMLGRAMTGGDGRALLSFVPRALGVEKVTVRLADNRRAAAPETTAVLFVWDRRRPVVIVSLSALAIQSRPAEPEDGAVPALMALTRHAHLVYVTPKDRLELEEARRWMDQHRFPAGPLFPLRTSPHRLASELEAWRREGWTNIRGGIVTTAEEAKTLVETGLKAVASPNAPSKEKWPDKTVTTKDWKQVLSQFN